MNRSFMNRRISVYGLRRSGNHAIVEWLNKNLGGSPVQNKISSRFLHSGSSCYLNSVTEYEYSSIFEVNYKFAMINFPNVIATHEDCFTSYETRLTKGFPKIVIIRDILNVVASRYKLLMKRHPDKVDNGNLCSINENIFQIWIENVLSAKKKCMLVKFEEWVASRQYRDAISAKLKVKNLDVMGQMSFHGGGSSFGNLSSTPSLTDLNNRWKQVDIPSKFIRRIESQDIKSLRKQLGYIND